MKITKSEIVEDNKNTFIHRLHYSDGSSIEYGHDKDTNVEWVELLELVDGISHCWTVREAHDLGIRCMDYLPRMLD